MVAVLYDIYSMEKIRPLFKRLIPEALHHCVVRICLSMFSFLTVLMLASSSVLAFETCEECLENIVAFGGLVNEHKVSMSKEQYYFFIGAVGTFLF
jgi:hypothetical protein